MKNSTEMLAYHLMASQRQGITGMQTKIDKLLLFMNVYTGYHNSSEEGVTVISVVHNYILLGTFF